MTNLTFFFPLISSTSNAIYVQIVIFNQWKQSFSLIFWQADSTQHVGPQEWGLRLVPHLPLPKASTGVRYSRICLAFNMINK